MTPPSRQIPLTPFAEGEKRGISRIETVPIAGLMEQSGVGFGTSGARGLAHAMTDRVCYAYTAAFLDYLTELGEVASGPDDFFRNIASVRQHGRLLGDARRIDFNQSIGQSVNSFAQLRLITAQHVRGLIFNPANGILNKCKP